MTEAIMIDGSIKNRTETKLLTHGVRSTAARTRGTSGSNLVVTRIWLYYMQYNLLFENELR